MKPTLFICRWSVLFLLLILAACAGSRNMAAKTEAANHRRLAQAYMQEQKYTLALKELLRAEKKYSQDHLLQEYIGICYLEKDRPEKAAIHFKKSLEIKPGYSSARNSLGTAYLKMGKWNEAVTSFREVLEGEYGDFYATPHYAHANLGLAYYHLQDYASSEKHYTEALHHYYDGFSKDQTYILSAIGLARTRIALGQPKEAVSLLNKTIEEFNTIPRLYFELAQAYRALGQTDDARSAYARCAQLAPGTPLAQAAAREMLILP